MPEINDRKEFEERADFIDNDDLLNWTVENEHFRDIQKKLLAKGAKLLAGPRGSGKTHHMKVAYNRSLRTNTLAIYVSFGKYYHLEPLLYK
ncbi:MAG: zinc ribbon domain-containing protein, partial [Candidatus Aminicenantes bacterium]